MKAKKSILVSFFSAALLFIFLSWNNASSYSTDAETQGSILYVKPGANGICSSWADACELQTALFNAVAGDQIWVAAGTYKPSSSNRLATFQLESGVAIYGGFPAAGGGWETRDWESNITTLSGDIGILNDNEDNSYHVVTGSGVDETALLDGFIITGGNANGWDADGKGGGMYNDQGSPTLNYLIFSGNMASRGGGMGNTGSSTPTLTNVTFSNNATTGSYGYGGGMYNSFSSPSLINVTFNENTTIGYGGGMYNENYSSPKLTNITFLNNIANHGGGVYNDNSNSTLNNVTFLNNIVNYGGGMYNYMSSPTLNDVTFSSNTAYESAGGMYNSSSSPSLSIVTFSDNSAESERGGGMYNESSSPTLIDVTFSNNLATYGGGMYNLSSSPILTNVAFSDNTAAGLMYCRGGGMSNDKSSPTLTNVTFSANSACYGGGLDNFQSIPALNEVIFSGNLAKDSGGGMLNDNASSPTLTNVTFSSNSATYYGGGMANIGSSTPSLSNVTFSGNSANVGGGMSNKFSNPSLSNVTFSSNSAIYYGGGMHNDEESMPTLTNVTFNGNTANNGGGMHNSISSPSLSNVTFSGNSATTSGGGMSNYGFSHYLSIVTLSNVTFSSNSASNGGGMVNYREVHVSLTNVTFSSNSASDSGGGMYNDSDGTDGTVALTNVTFTGNSAYWGYGGGIGGEDMTMTITNSIIWGNTPDQVSGSAAVTYSDIQGGHTGLGNIDADPLLGFLADNGGFTLTHALVEGSPAIDTGDPTNCPVIDQRGYARPIDGDGLGGPRCDMGAFEYGSYPATYALTLDIVGSGSITKDPDKSEYLWGEVVTLTPVANPDWIFIGWSGDTSGMNNPLTVTIFEDTNITANFRFEAWTLTTSVFPEGTGDVVLYPDKPTYQYGEQVTLTAIPNPSWYFAGWTGDASGFSSQIIVTMTDNLDITANFSQAEYSLSVSVSPPGMGTVTLSSNKPYYHYGDTVTLTATGVTGWWLESWGGNASGRLNPLTITVLGNTNIVANFTDTEITYLPLIIR